MSSARGGESFRLEAWWDRVGAFAPDQWGNRALGAIIGPRDACHLVHLRKLAAAYIDFGPPKPSDVFILGIGEPPYRDWTKIGGLPFWPRGRAWPHSDRDLPLPFLAQFDFRDSKDIVGDLPADILLLFGDKRSPSKVVAKWQSSKYSGPLVQPEDMPIAPTSPCFYGVRWRTESFPHARLPKELILEDGSRVLEPWTVCEVVGMQIGPAPYLPPQDQDVRETHRIMCSLCAFYPQPEIPWQFINRPEPLNEREAQDLMFELTEFEGYHYMRGRAVVCVVMGSSGELEVIASEDDL